MKKLIVFGLAVVTACAVNAASFVWAATTVNGVDGNGNTLTSTADAATFVLCYLGNTGDATAPSYDSAVVVQEGTWTIGTTKGVSSAKVGGSYTGSGTGGLADGNVYAVMVQDDDGGLHQVSGVNTYTVSGYSGDTWAGPTYTFASSNYVADKASYSGGDIPEPTSGLLLLVGAGMLALRRKRK